MTCVAWTPVGLGHRLDLGDERTNITATQTVYKVYKRSEQFITVQKSSEKFRKQFRNNVCKAKTNIDKHA